MNNNKDVEMAEDEKLKRNSVIKYQKRIFNKEKIFKNLQKFFKI